MSSEGPRRRSGLSGVGGPLPRAGDLSPPECGLGDDDEPGCCCWADVEASEAKAAAAAAK